jgi:hypothetical protein
MKSGKHILSWFSILLLFCCSLSAQQMSSLTATVPRLVNFSGKATDLQGKVISGIAGATFGIYKEQSGGSPLWLETQNIQADAKGNYTVQLGATKPDGLPLDLFSSGEARWLGVTVNGGQEQARVLLLSVPYALKAADAETVGGLPPSAFVLAAPPASGTTNPSASPSTGTSASSVPPPNSAVTGLGTVNFLPLWDTTSDIISSAVFQSGSGSTAKVGINTTTPSSTLDVNGTGTVRGNLSLPATGTATATAGKNSQPTTLTASAFNSGTAAAESQNFRLQAEPAGNNTASPRGTLNLLYGSGSNAINETGLKIASNGKITFASGQTFPGTGTVTSVGLSAPSTDFTVSGSPVTKSGTLNLKWNVAPTNTNVANSIVKRDATGSFSATTITATGQLFATALSGNGNAIFGSSSSPVATVIYGGANSSTGAVWGVEGEQFSSDPGASGVVGRAHSGGVGVTGLNGNSNGTAGVYGQLGGPSVWGIALPSAGVWGDTSQSGHYAGVLGTAGLGYAGYFISNGGTTLALQNYDSSGSLLYAQNVSNSASCQIDPVAHLTCTGGIGAVVPLNGGKRKVALASIESPENWFEDFGSAQLINGAAVIQLDQDFIQSVNTEKDYRVFAEPNGDCKGLYVTNKSANSFEVRELGGGTSNIRFDYRITAIRRKYETVRFADHTNDPGPRKMLEQMHKVKPTASSDPASVKPASPAAAGVAVAQLSNK